MGKRILSLVLIASILISCNQTVKATPPDNQRHIKIALLLDTSGSMSGLIEQAKSQLWKIVNELSRTKYNDEVPKLEIALYEYGNDGLSVYSNYIRKILPLSTDMDAISQQLFSLRTNGGSEYCGAVIQTALNQLEWSNDDKDLQMIFIAGNEAFTQGGVDYVSACLGAKNKNIVVNTIFCGAYNEGIQTSWKSGASIANGTYMNIDMNERTVYIPSPYDDRINALNTKLNGTYMAYGNKGEVFMSNQITQDSNAKGYSSSNAAERAKFKSSKMYKNSSWDIVDAFDDDAEVLEEVDEKTLPAELKGKSIEEKKVIIEEKKQERIEIQKQIREISKEREVFLVEKRKELDENEESLDKALLAAIKKQAQEKNYQFTDID